MKTNITSNNGVTISARGENGVFIEGNEYHEAPFIGRWDDFHGVLSEGTGPASLTYEAYRDTGFFMKFFRYNQSDSIFTVYQMPHTWDYTSNIRPHMHCIPMAAVGGNVAFTYVYTWTVYGDEFPPASGWVTGSIITTFAASEQFKHKSINFGTIIPPANAAESTMLVMKVERTPSLDTYSGSKDTGTAAANLAILDFDVHYQKLKAGSIIEWGDNY